MTQKLKLGKEFKLHLSHYLTLSIILLVGLGAFFIFRFYPSYQVAIVVLTGFSYVLWGLIHHWLCGDLHLKVILEYILVALLASLLVSSLIFRA